MRLFNVYHGGDLFVAQVFARDSEHALQLVLKSYYSEDRLFYTACGIK